MPDRFQRLSQIVLKRSLITKTVKFDFSLGNESKKERKGI